MKNLIFIITVILCTNLYAQNKFENTNIFVRVYDFEGRKIGKGKILSISETSLQLSRNGKPIKIMVNDIGSIKTKHSVANNLVVGTVIGATVMAFIGAASARSDNYIIRTPGSGAVAGVYVGGPIGAIIGGFSAIFKNSKSYKINGDMERWEVFKKIIIN